jgi:hypothetical protein
MITITKPNHIELPDLVEPVANLNGNSARSLVILASACADALEKAEQTLAGASDLFHGRNLQTVENGSEKMDAARRAILQRRRLLAEMHREFVELAIAIDGQEEGR